MSHLVEQKLKKLHYFPPNFRVQPPHSILAAHPLLASIPKKAFRKEVRPMAHASCASIPPIPHHRLQPHLTRKPPPAPAEAALHRHSRSTGWRLTCTDGLLRVTQGYCESAALRGQQQVRTHFPPSGLASSSSGCVKWLGVSSATVAGRRAWPCMIALDWACWGLAQWNLQILAETEPLHTRSYPQTQQLHSGGAIMQEWRCRA